MSSNQLFSIDEAAAKAFPEIKIGYAIVRNVTLKEEDSGLEALKQDVIAQIQAQLQGQKVVELSRVRAFRQIYKKFGVDPNSKRPSAEALLRRIQDPAKGLYQVNTVVDAYNLTSAQYQLPMAAYDLDQVTLPVSLRFARPQEPHQGIGQAEPDLLSENELVYADQRLILCRDFNYRDADATKVTLETKNLIVFVDAYTEVERAELEEALHTVVQRIVQFNGGHAEHLHIADNTGH